jgi:SAM-dependent methyltransferase
VLGVDLSAELIAVARNREWDGGERPQFIVADLLAVSLPTFIDAVLCRGVLNDFVEDGDRSRIFLQFHTWLRPGGILIFDVREWTRTLDRYTKNRLYRRTVGLPTGRLEFQSETILDLQSRQLRIRERFNMERGGVMMHKFWTVTDPMMAQIQMILFMKNLSMLGGALLISQFGAGPFSLDARRSR